MTKWGHVLDIWAAWSDDDPAVRMGRGPQSAPDGPGEPAAPELAQIPAPQPPPALTVAEKRARVEACVARIRSGDLTAVEELRRLLDGYSESA